MGLKEESSGNTAENRLKKKKKNYFSRINTGQLTLCGCEYHDEKNTEY